MAAYNRNRRCLLRYRLRQVRRLANQLLEHRP